MSVSRVMKFSRKYGGADRDAIGRGPVCLLVSVIALVIGCETGSTSIVKQSKVSFGRYQVLEIPDFEGIGPEPIWPALPIVSKAVRKEIADTVAEQLRESKLFAEVSRENRGAAESVLLMKGQFLKYNPGSRTARYMGQGESGKTSIIVNVTFIETTTGRELAEVNVKGEITGGLFGGSGTETHNQISQEIVQFIRDSL